MTKCYVMDSNGKYILTEKDTGNQKLDVKTKVQETTLEALEARIKILESYFLTNTKGGSTNTRGKK